MTNTYAENAILAKVRALYGKRITKEDYEQLLQKKEPAEISAYLKKETYFADSMKEVQEGMIHRGQLEAFIRRRPYDVTMRLMKYTSGDALFLKSFVMKNEINQILLAVRLLNAKQMGSYITSLPAYFDKHTSLDLFALAQARSFDDLMTVLEKSPYHDLLRRFRPTGADARVDITGCETQLLTYYYEQMLTRIDKQYTGSTRAELRELMEYQIQLHNFNVIYRLKRHFHSPAETIAKYLILIKGVTTASKYENLLEANDISTLLAASRKHPLAKQFPLGADTSAQDMAHQINRLRRDVNQKRFRFSVKPVVAVFSYMALLDVEVNNITNIIEGTRYEVPVDEIRRTLAM